MHMPSEFGLIVILLIVVLLFGGGRIAKVSGELGTALREFRRGLIGGLEEDTTRPEAENLPSPQAGAEESKKPS